MESFLVLGSLLKEKVGNDLKVNMGLLNKHKI